MKSIRRSLAVATLGVAATLAAPTSGAAPTEDVRGGATIVHLSDDFIGALGALGVAPAAIRPGRLFTRGPDVKAGFPIVRGGLLDLTGPTGEIPHAGGLSLTAGGTVVELSGFVIDLASAGGPVLTGLVVVNDDFVGRVPLFDLDLSASEPEIRARVWVVVPDVIVTLSAVAADALNGIFGVDAFVEGLPIGEATVWARLARGHDEHDD